MKKRYWFLFFIVLFGIVFFILLKDSARAPEGSVKTPVPEAPASKDDLIVLESPRPKQAITSPLTISGKARGNWFFEGSFPVQLTNWDGLIIAQGVATAQGDWMTTEYVPFTATLTFMKPQNAPNNTGSLILKKDNPSGEPQFDNALEIAITF